MVEIDCEKPIKLETSPKVTKSKRSLHWCRSISKKISVQVLLQYQSKSYYIIGQEVYYSIGRFITLSGSYYIIGRFFITLSGSYYSIGRLLHYRLVQHPPSLIVWPKNESLPRTTVPRSCLVVLSFVGIRWSFRCSVQLTRNIRR